jgi:hypothetical protein
MEVFSHSSGDMEVWALANKFNLSIFCTIERSTPSAPLFSSSRASEGKLGSVNRC